MRAETARASTELEELRRSYREKKQVYDQLVRQIAVFDEKMAFAELGSTSRISSSATARPTAPRSWRCANGRKPWPLPRRPWWRTPPGPSTAAPQGPDDEQPQRPANLARLQQ